MHPPFRPAKPIAYTPEGYRYTGGMRFLWTFVVALLVAFVSACTSTPATDGHTDHDHAKTDAATAEHSADDVSFATMMIPHHRQAVDMAKLVPERSTDPAVVELASAIDAAQGPEIDQMTSMLRQWGEDPGGTAGHEGHGAMMQGMVDDATMTRLESLRGKEFDTLWLQSMIGHHEGAVEMAKAEIAHGQNADAKALAEKIVSAQEEEIAQMKQMLGGGQP
jgi:uncharacterized protein (DUF305 family)